MTFIIGLLTFVLVVICAALILLVLIQLPKKEAGIGVAFGGGATDALFGAGSGTVLTKTTRYAAIGFFGLCLLVGILQSRYVARKSGSEFQRAVEQQAQQAAPVTPPANTTPPAAAQQPLMSQPATATPAAAPATAPAKAPEQK